MVDGRIANDPSARVSAASVRVDGEPLDHPDGLLIMLHKPAGFVCSHDPAEGPSIYDLVPSRWRQRNPVVTSIGRLDKETTGLILITDQSALVHRLTSPKKKVPKLYRVIVEHDLDASLVPRFASGELRLAGETEPSAPAALSLVAPRVAELELTEGRYHQVRRMFAECGWSVLELHRARFGAISLDDLPPGKWRELPLDQPI